MSEEYEYKAIWSGRKGNIKVDLPLIVFEEDGSQIIYCPALEISGYGQSEPEALESFNVSLGEFLLYAMNKNTLASEMKRLGWLVSNKKSKPMIPPSMTQLLEKNENLSRIFNNFPFRKINESVTLPA